MARNGKRARIYIIEDDLAQIVAGLLAADELKQLTDEWTGQPYVSLDDIDKLSRLRRDIEAGLHAGRDRKLEELKEVREQ